MPNATTVLPTYRAYSLHTNYLLSSGYMRTYLAIELLEDKYMVNDYPQWLTRSHWSWPGGCSNIVLSMWHSLYQNGKLMKGWLSNISTWWGLQEVLQGHSAKLLLKRFMWPVRWCTTWASGMESSDGMFWYFEILHVSWVLLEGNRWDSCCILFVNLSYFTSDSGASKC